MDFCWFNVQIFDVMDDLIFSCECMSSDSWCLHFKLKFNQFCCHYIFQKKSYILAFTFSFHSCSQCSLEFRTYFTKMAGMSGFIMKVSLKLCINLNLQFLIWMNENWNIFIFDLFRYFLIIEIFQKYPKEIPECNSTPIILIIEISFSV